MFLRAIVETITLGVVLTGATMAAAQNYPVKPIRIVTGASPHLAAELFKSMTGTNLTHIP